MNKKQKENIRKKNIKILMQQKNYKNRIRKPIKIIQKLKMLTLES